MPAYLSDHSTTQGNAEDFATDDGNDEKKSVSSIGHLHDSWWH